MVDKERYRKTNEFRSATVATKISQTLKEKIKEAAKKEEMSLSSYLAWLLEDYHSDKK